MHKLLNFVKKQRAEEEKKDEGPAAWRSRPREDKKEDEAPGGGAWRINLQRIPTKTSKQKKSFKFFLSFFVLFQVLAPVVTTSLLQLMVTVGAELATKR